MDSNNALPGLKLHSQTNAVFLNNLFENKSSCLTIVYKTDTGMIGHRHRNKTNKSLKSRNIVPDN